MNYDPNIYDPNIHMIVPGIAKADGWCMGYGGTPIPITGLDVGCTRMLILPRPHDLAYFLANAKPHELWVGGKVPGNYRLWENALQHQDVDGTWRNAVVYHSMTTATDWRPVEPPEAAPNPRDCVHGWPLGTCEACKREEHIVELERQLAERDRVSHLIELGLRERLAVRDTRIAGLLDQITGYSGRLAAHDHAAGVMEAKLRVQDGETRLTLMERTAERDEARAQLETKTRS